MNPHQISDAAPTPAQSTSDAPQPLPEPASESPEIVAETAPETAPETASEPIRSAPETAPMAPTLRLIAGFKLLQGLFLLLVGAGLLMFVKNDANIQVAHWLGALKIDTGSRLMHDLLGKLDAISPLKFQRLSLGAFLYSALLMTEGTGLLLRKGWAEHLTILVTGSFLPWEGWEVVHHFSVATLVILLANAGVVWYLVAALKKRGTGIATG